MTDFTEKNAQKNVYVNRRIRKLAAMCQAFALAELVGMEQIVLLTLMSAKPLQIFVQITQIVQI